VERIRGKKRIDLAHDPPPDLVIEIEITSPALNRLPIYAGFGVPEIWTANSDRVTILHLSQGRYLTRKSSEVLPPLDAAGLTRFVEQSTTLTTLAWRKVVREWARQHRP
jgi:Uma2 family endonuclease